MNFDYTHGKRVGYSVNIWNWQGGDRYFFHYLKNAKAFFEKVEAELEDGYSVSLFNEYTGERMRYTKAANGKRVPVITIH